MEGLAHRYGGGLAYVLEGLAESYCSGGLAFS